MELDYNRLYENIFKRVSTRSFSNNSIDISIMEKLFTKANEINKESDDFHITIVPEANESVYKGIIGSYGKVRNAPIYAVFSGNRNDNDVMLKVGYFGELFILDILSENMSTCWMSGTINRDSISRQINLSCGFDIYAITPIGYADKYNSTSHSLIKMFLKSGNRKPINEISNLDEIANKDEWMMTVAEAVRKAPSARNIQPWYLEFGDKKVTLKDKLASEDNNKKTSINIGIAKLHLELALLKCNLKYNYVEANDGIIFEIV